MKIGDHVIVKPINYGQKIIIGNGVKRILYKKGMQPLNELDLLLNRNLERISIDDYVQYPELSFFVKVNNKDIFLEKIEKDDCITSNRSNLKYYSSKLDMALEPISFEGKINELNVERVSLLAEQNDMMCIVNNKVIKKNKIANKSKDYNQLLVTEIIDFFITNNKLIAFERTNNYWKNYINLLTEMFILFVGVNDKILIEDDYKYDINSKFIPEKHKKFILSNEQLTNGYRLFLTLFYTEKNNWNGFFYTDFYKIALEDIKQKIQIEITSAALNISSFLNY